MLCSFRIPQIRSNGNAKIVAEMAVLTSEAVVLRTWPVHEADLLVSFFTRDYGKMKGVAKAALRSRKRFGGALEPMTVARAWFVEKPKQELVRLDQLEIIRSPLSLPVDAARLMVLSVYAEVLEQALPDHDPQETVFRLILSVLEQTTVERTWMPLTYFELWMTRLMGLLPDLAHCIACGEALIAGETSFNAYADGLFCRVHRPGNASELSADAWQMALKMLRAPVGAFVEEQWPRRRGEDLRHFALQALERHMERKLKSAEMLARMSF
jgi:DNA repair protein RecO (recombination protein O)